MIVSYRFSSPLGDVPVRSEQLSLPFKIDLTQEHPFLTLFDYYQVIESFVRDLSLHKNLLIPKGSMASDSERTPVERLFIRSEKHGAFYHIASVEILAGNKTWRFAVITALSKENRKHLHREFHILRDLGKRYPYPYLPRVFAIKELPAHGTAGRVAWTLVLAEWYENYHEWHFASCNGLKGQKILLWDYGKGFRWLTKRESLELFRQAARILTLYVDGVNFSQIYPWHHGAGDFVVRVERGECTVKLTTARNYKPILFFPEGQKGTPHTALLYFLLNMTIRMRLDRVDGFGKTIWADPWLLPAVLKGFFDGLQGMVDHGRKPLIQPIEFRTLLKSFTQKEFGILLQPLLALYKEEGSQDLSIIEKNLVSHREDLYQVCQALPS